MDVFQTLLPGATPPAQTGVSDDQIDEMRRYAEALRTSSQQPVHHWLQGVSNVVGDVMSGLESNQADRMRAKQRQDYITALGGDAAGGAAPAPAPNSDARNTAAVLRGEPITPPAAPDANAGAAPPPTDYYKRLAQVESGGNPNARSGSYSGLYQLGPEEQKIGVQGVTERNRAALAHALQRDPTDAELYMAHQQGIGGALSHMANPDQPAWRSMRNTAEGQNKGDGWARQAIWGNMTPQMKAQFPGGVDTVPSGAFTQMWAQRWNNGAASRPPADLPLPAPPKPEAPLPPMRNPAMSSDGALRTPPPLSENSSDGAKPGADSPAALNAINEDAFSNSAKPGAPPPAAPNPITAGVLSGGASPGATPVQAARVTSPAMPPAAPAPIPTAPAGASQPMVTPQDQVQRLAINLIRAGMSNPLQAINTASAAVQARQGFQATYAPNEWGQVVRTAPGQLPTIVPGQQLGPGKAVTRYGVAGYETMGPDGVPQFKPAPLPSFGGQGGSAPAAPVGGAAPTPTPTAAPPGSAPAAPWKPTAGGPPPPIPQTLDQARTYEDNMAAWKIAQTENSKANAELEAKRMPEQAAFEAQQMREKEAARIAAETSPEALAGKAKGGALTKQAEAYVTRQQTLEKQARDAQDELPQLEMLKRVIANPDFYSGIFSKQIGDVKQLADKIGMAPSQTATLMQFAKKLGAAGSLEQIREMGQQGAVRVPEMHMIEKSNFDPDNTQEANAAVVELRARLAQRSMEMADLANKYADQHGGLIDRGYDQFIRDYYKDKPLVRDDELQNYEQLLDRKRPTSTESARTGSAPLPTSLPPGFKVTPPNG